MADDSSIASLIQLWKPGTPSTIFHCWQKTGILVPIDISSVGRYELKYLSQVSEIMMRKLLLL